MVILILTKKHIFLKKFAKVAISMLFFVTYGG